MKKDVLVVILVSVWIILAIFIGIYDLDISSEVVNQNSGWAIFLENYGMIPGIIVILSGIFIYYSNIKSRADLWSYIIKTVFFLVGSGLIFYLAEILLGDFVINKLIFSLSVSFTIGLFIFMLIHKLSQVKNQLLIKYSKVVVGMALFGYVIGIQVTKFLWGRIRFRQLDAVFSQFTPWYLPQGITGFDSFPSGHAAMGWILLALLVLFDNSKVWIKNVLLMLIFIWSVLLAYSRVVIGAHFGSDVLFGSFIIIFTFLCLRCKSSKD